MSFLLSDFSIVGAAAAIGLGVLVRYVYVSLLRPKSKTNTIKELNKTTTHSDGGHIFERRPELEDFAIGGNMMPGKLPEGHTAPKP
jgi:hypothetical protein